MNKKTSIVLSGVGGQGIITAANILGKASVNAGVKVYVSEVHGMAQRGGSVICTVRMGNVFGPLVASGTAEAIVSTEPIEALRYIRYANNKTKVVVDVNPVVPFTVTVGGENYPNLGEVFLDIESRAELYKIDALKIAKDCGNIIVKNIVMLGALSATKVLPYKSNILLNTITDNIPLKYKEMNKKAFEAGIKAIEKY